MGVQDESSTSQPNTNNSSESNLPNKNHNSALASVINKLKEKQEIQELTKKVIDQDLSKTKEDTPQILSNSNDLIVEQIGSNNVAVFQTLLKNVSEKNDNKKENMKSQVSIDLILF